MTPILLLSPMQSISDLAPGVAETLGIDIAIETSDDACAQKIIRNHAGIEVVVTRGGLAERARQIAGISVVEISMSLNELLTQLSSLTAEGFRRIGIVSRANLFSGATGDFSILDAHVSIRPQPVSSLGLQPPWEQKVPALTPPLRQELWLPLQGHHPLPF